MRYSINDDDVDAWLDILIVSKRSNDIEVIKNHIEYLIEQMTYEVSNYIREDIREEWIQRKLDE